MNELWTSLAAAGGCSLDPEREHRLHRYLDLLLVANETMNLTRVTDRAAAELHHIADALTLLPHLPAGPHRLAEVGSGGGSPGLPLAIVLPEATVLLIESTKKKAAFLTRAIAELELANVQVAPCRAEEVARTAQRESFDRVIARAVGPLDFLAEFCLPLVKIGGHMLAMKGPRVNDELPAAKRAIGLLGGGAPLVHLTDLPGAGGHVIVDIRKDLRTSARYPRPPAQQKGRPLA